MLQQNALPSSLSSAPGQLSGGLTGSIRETLRNNPLGTVMRILSMPLDRAAFVWWTVIMLLFGAGAGVHIWLSVQIAQAESQLTLLQAEHTEFELANAELMWQISQYTSLPVVQSRATSMGFRNDYANLYMPLAADLPPVVMTTDPVVQALPTANPTQPVAASQPAAEARQGDGPLDLSSRLDFGRLGISVQRTDWVQDLRLRTDGFFTDLNLGFNTLWSDLRAYGQQTWQRMAGDPNRPKTTIAATR